MSTFRIAIEVGNLAEDRFEVVEALVDTGASHSIFPARLLRGLGSKLRRRGHSASPMNVSGSLALVRREYG
jgi:hypothetical protein